MNLRNTKLGTMEYSIAQKEEVLENLRRKKRNEIMNQKREELERQRLAQPAKKMEEELEFNEQSEMVIEEEKPRYSKLEQSLIELCDVTSRLRELNLNSRFRLTVEIDNIYDTSQRFNIYYRNTESNDVIKYDENIFYYDFNRRFFVTERKIDRLTDRILGENDVFVFVHEFFEVFNNFNDCYLESYEDIEKPKYIKISIKEDITRNVPILTLEPSEKNIANDSYIIENEIFFIKPFIILYLIKYFDLKEQEYRDDLYYINDDDKEELSEYLKNNDTYKCEQYYKHIVDFIRNKLWSNYTEISINGDSIKDFIDSFMVDGSIKNSIDSSILYNSTVDSLDSSTLYDSIGDSNESYKPQETIENFSWIPIYTDSKQPMDQLNQTTLTDGYNYLRKGGKNKNKQVIIINNLYYKYK